MKQTTVLRSFFWHVICTFHGKEIMNNLDRIAFELRELDNDLVEIDGVRLKPSQCYHYEADPLHILFNTNCPDSLKQKVEAILSRHIPQYESNSSPES